MAEHPLAESEHGSAFKQTHRCESLLIGLGVPPVGAPEGIATVGFTVGVGIIEIS
jgi:hypothetical protein